MKLKAATRNTLPASKFGMPKQRKYPMQDREHAGLAKGYAKKEVAKGKLSPAMASKIRTKANKILGGSSAGAAY